MGIKPTRVSYSLKESSPPFAANQDIFAIHMMKIHKNGGANDNPDMTAARTFLRLAYAIHATIAKPMGRMGYDQTAMTIAHASAVTPESNAITESPAISSHGTRESTASSWERIIQMRRPVRLG